METNKVFSLCTISKEGILCTFENVWSFLQRKLKSGAVVQNWTADKGYLGDDMTVINVSRNSVTVKAPKAQNLQNVPKEDFGKVWKVWAGYKNQNIRRYELRDMTRFSKYIISILHWYEEEA